MVWPVVNVLSRILGSGSVDPANTWREALQGHHESSKALCEYMRLHTKVLHAISRKLKHPSLEFPTAGCF